MEIELHCSACGNRFQAPEGLTGGDALERMVDEGMWFILADGATFAEMIRAAERSRGLIRCGECSEAVTMRRIHHAECQPLSC